MGRNGHRRHREQGGQRKEADPAREAVSCGFFAVMSHGATPLALDAMAIKVTIDPDGSLARARRFDDGLRRNCDSRAASPE